eukprot:17265-Heterococcus_DN1.PRE.2
MSVQAAKLIQNVIASAWTQASVSSEQDKHELYFIPFDKLFTSTLTLTHRKLFINFIVHDVGLIDASLVSCDDTADQLSYKFGYTYSSLTSANPDVLSMRYRPTLFDGNYSCNMRTRCFAASDSASAGKYKVEAGGFSVKCKALPMRAINTVHTLETVIRIAELEGNAYIYSSEAVAAVIDLHLGLGLGLGL